ncbi:MAG: TolB family protein [Algoriphagus aquaeductus]|uniref:TolB family protein n=1 Tax=Algoriphagus aquaeductus TaxID=475299 RepID=UPI00391D8620
MKKKLSLIGFIALLFACESNKFRTGQFPENPVNLGEVNSPFDDINSDIPFLSHKVPLVFSTNRGNNQPKDFNLIVSSFDFNWDKSEGVLLINSSNTLFDSKFQSFQDMVRRTESPAHEKGPYSFLESENNRVLLFSREENGVYKIFSEQENPTSNARITQSHQILDENLNEMYPCFYGKDFIKGMEKASARPENLIFSSDKDGKFDIYEADIPSGKSPLQFLGETNSKTVRKLSLSTSSNDHMPFVFADLLVFSSDRPGGFGGYDLYYSQKTINGWSEPINFGSKINSEFDEYRPVVSEHPEFNNRLMIFSSNRPGGLGGFDLYFVGIPKF